jgi:hypothetical protein
VSVVALMSWWDENPSWLTRSVTPLARFCTHLIAVDGAYEHMAADGRPQSAGDQADAIVAACDATGLGLTLHRPNEPWVGDEVAKRTFMFQQANLTCRPGDWLFVIDADEMVFEVPGNIHQQLANAEADGFEAATVNFSEPPARGFSPVRKFFRHDPTLRVEGRHYWYAAGPPNDLRLLWGNGGDPRTVPSYHIDGFTFEHWSTRRHPFRRQAQLDYYARRKTLRLETDV